MPVLYRVALAQISQKIGDNFHLPYSVGLLQAYAQAHAAQAERFAFLPPMYRRLSTEQALQHFEGADIIGFSTYVWNIRLSLTLAQAIKSRWPQALILFGGPQVPDRAEDFLRKHPFIDLCTHGAGEELFTQILDDYAQAPEAQGRSHWPALEGVSYLDEQGRFQHRAPAPRTRDLSQHPSPFLSGVFDALLKENKAWFTAFETNRGCPFRCSFCDWGSAIASKVVRFEQSRLEQELRWLAEHQIKSVFCADANFGMLKRDLELAQRVAQLKAETGYPESFQTQTAKNVTRRVIEIQKILTEAGLSASTAISLQSLNPQALQAIQRENISLKAYQEIQEACHGQGIFTYTDIILGLPQEDYSSFTRGISEVMQNGQLTRVLFHNAAILPNAEMAQPEYRARYGLQTTEIPIPYYSQASDEVLETLEIVVGTHAMPGQEWLRAQVFAWMSSFLFYTHKLAQLVLLLLHDTLQVDFVRLIELFTESDLSAYPVLSGIQADLWRSALKQQQGVPECLTDNLVLTPVEGIYLTPELTLQIQLGLEGKIDAFYMELADYLGRFARRQQADYPLTLLKETLLMNRRLFFKMYSTQNYPLQHRRDSQPLHFHYNLPAYFEARLRGEQIPLRPLNQAVEMAL